MVVVGGMVSTLIHTHRGRESFRESGVLGFSEASLAILKKTTLRIRVEALFVEFPFRNNNSLNSDTSGNTSVALQYLTGI